MARAVLVPLAELISRQDGDCNSRFPMPLPIQQPFTIEVFFPGRPRAKDRGTPRPGKNGGAFIFTSPEVKEKERYIREEFMQTMKLLYPDKIKYLPITTGWCWLELYFLLPPPENGYFPGKPHVGAPDSDNLYKLVKDALSGRAAGRPPLAFKDDSMSAGAYPIWKTYWDPSRIDVPGYPPSAGTHIVIHYEVSPRDPKFLPVGKEVCNVCGKDEFVSSKAKLLHERKCKI